MEHCSQCGGTLKIIAAIEHPSVIAKILRAFADRLKAAGKPAQVAIVACMRKLLSIMNALPKSNLPWNPKIAYNEHGCSPTSACPPEHRPDRPRGHSIDSKWPSDPSPRPPPTRFHFLSPPPALPCTRLRGQNASDPGASDR